MPATGGALAPAAPRPPARLARLQRPVQALRRRHLATAAAVLPPTALSAVLVLHGLAARSIWIDEASTFAVASQRGAVLGHYLARAGGDMLLYYAGMHLLVGLFGASLVVLRLPSALAAVACVPVGFALADHLLGRRAASFGAWLLAVCLPTVFWGQQARGYAPAELFVSAAALSLVEAVRSRRRLAWACFVACSVLAAYTTLLATVAVLALLLALLSAPGRRELLPRAALAAAGVAVACVPLALLATDRGTSGLGWLGAPGTAYGPSYVELAELLASTRVAGIAPGAAAGPVALATAAAWAGAAGILLLRARRGPLDVASWGYVLLGSWLLLPPLVLWAASMLVHPVLEDRYVLFCVPAGSLLAGAAVSRIRPALAALAVLAALLGSRAALVLPVYAVPIEDWSAAAAQVARSERTGDCIAFFLADGEDAFDYYADEERLREPRPVLPSSPYSARAPYSLDPEVFTKGALGRASSGCRRLWLVRSHASAARLVPGAPPFQVLKRRRYLELLAEVRSRYRLDVARPYPGVLVELYLPRPGPAGLGRRPMPSRTGVVGAISSVTKKSDAVIPDAPPVPDLAARR